MHQKKARASKHPQQSRMTIDTRYAIGPPEGALEFTILQMICTFIGVVLIIYNLNCSKFLNLDSFLSPHSIMFIFIIGMFVALLGESSMDQASLAVRLGAMCHGIGEVIICFFILFHKENARKYGKIYLSIWIITIYIACWLFKPLNAFLSVGLMLVTGDAFVFVTGLTLIFGKRENVNNLVKFYGLFILLEFINGFALVSFNFFGLDNAVLWTFQSYRWICWMFYVFIFLKKSESELIEIGFLFDDKQIDHDYNRVNVSESEREIDVEAQIVTSNGNKTGLFSSFKMSSIWYALTMTFIITGIAFGAVTIIAMSVGTLKFDDLLKNEDNYYYPGPPLAF